MCYYLHALACRVITRPVPGPTPGTGEDTLGQLRRGVLDESWIQAWGDVCHGRDLQVPFGGSEKYLTQRWDHRELPVESQMVSSMLLEPVCSICIIVTAQQGAFGMVVVVGGAPKLPMSRMNKINKRTRVGWKIKSLSFELDIII